MQETLADMYREQCLQVWDSILSCCCQTAPPIPPFLFPHTHALFRLRQLEDELCRLREEREAAKSYQDDKVRTQAQRTKMWKSRYEALEKRRALEAEVRLSFFYFVFFFFSPPGRLASDASFPFPAFHAGLQNGHCASSETTQRNGAAAVQIGGANGRH